MTVTRSSSVAGPASSWEQANMLSSFHSVDETDIYDEVGANIMNVVTAVARRTENEHLDTAAALLRVDLSRSGVRAGQVWCREVLEALRRGDPVTIDLE
jgi:hypothetical protein